MLESQFSYRTEDNQYELSLSRCKTWKTSKHRVLIVMQHVPSDSLRNKTLLSKGIVQDTVINSLKYAEKTARKYDKFVPPAYAVVNFNNRRHLNLPAMQRDEAEQEFTRRVRTIIKKLKPHKVLVSGDNAAVRLFGVDHPEHTRGWVHEKDGIVYTHTLDLDRLLAKQGKAANLLGFWTRHLAHLLVGYHPFDTSKYITKPFYVDSIKKFDYMFEKLAKAKLVATDTESRNLTVYHNRLYTAQFALDDNPDRGYVIPIDHPQTPFSVEERKYIKKKIRSFLTKKKGCHNNPLVITFFGQFDYRLLRKQLNIPIIRHRAWEITAGEHLLDENTTELNDMGGTHGNLRATLARYRNDFYFKAHFSKEERNQIGSTRPDDPDFLKYASGDVTYCLRIYQMQLKMASTMEFEGKNYLPFYERHVEHIMGPTVHQLSHMAQDGSRVDRKYLRYLLGPSSPLRHEISRVEAMLRKHPDVIACNKELLAEMGIRTAGLFGGAAQWAWSPSKPAHRAKLFFDTLGLEPVSETASGEPAVDKKFLAHYRNSNEVVAMYDELTKLKKLLGTYVRGWRKLLDKDPDAREDDSMRPVFQFFNVVTGRLSSQRPNLQQIPSRGKLADIIKRLFITKKGRLLVRFDYSAHEVRCWSIVSGDKVLADAFRQGQKLRQEWIKNPSKEIKEELKTKGDLHIQNVKRFFGKWVAKSDPLRDAVKAVVFGVLYGKSAKTLGIDIGKDEEYAQGIINKMFSQFKAGARWVERMKKSAKDSLQANSVLGRRRCLYAVLTGDRSIIARQVRRGSNAPIQGAASEMGTVVSRNIMLEYYDMAEVLSSEPFMEGMTAEEIRVLFNRLVHDASYFTQAYKLIIPFIHVLQWEATYGIAQKLGKIYDMEFTIEPEIEIELGARDDKTYAWDWSMPSLIGAIVNSTLDAEELGLLEGTPEQVIADILEPHRNAKIRKYLQKNYPLLGVKDLDDVIVSAEADYLDSLKAQAKAAKPEEKEALVATYKRHKELLTWKRDTKR